MGKLLKTKLYGRNLSKGMNPWDVPFVRNILEVDERRTSTNEPENKKTNDDA